jgi:hypothetical protein
MKADGIGGRRENIGFYRRILLDHFIIRSPTNGTRSSVTNNRAIEAGTGRKSLGNVVCAGQLLS